MLLSAVLFVCALFFFTSVVCVFCASQTRPRNCVDDGRVHVAHVALHVRRAGQPSWRPDHQGDSQRQAQGIKSGRAFFSPSSSSPFLFFNFLMLSSFFSLPPSFVHSLYYYFSITIAPPCVLLSFASPSFSPLSLGKQTRKQKKARLRQKEKGKKHIHK